MSIPLTIECPHCLAKLKLPPDKVGRRIRCPKCAKPFSANSDETMDYEDVESVPEPVRRGTFGKKSGGRGRQKSKGGGQLPLPALVGGGVALLAIAGLLVFWLGSGKKVDPPRVAQADLATPDGGQAAPPTTSTVPPTAAHVAFNSSGKMPRALSSLPDWLIKDAPFDVQQFWVTVPADQNSAPLYLDALYEFSPYMEDYFTEDIRAQRTLTVKARYQRSRAFQKKNWTDAAFRNAVLDEHFDAFRKLLAAQQRPQCVFEIGWDVPSFAPLLAASRDVTRLAGFHIERDLERGDFNHALQMIGLILRLSRDLRPRTPNVVHCFADSIESSCRHQMVIPVLKSPRLKVSECDELLKMLQEHVSAVHASNSVLTTLQGDYIWRQMLLHDLQTQTGEFAESRFPKAFGTDNATRGAALVAALNCKDMQEMFGTERPNPEMGNMLDELLSAMKSEDFDRSATWEREQYRNLSNAVSQPYAARREADRMGIAALRKKSEAERLNFMKTVPPGTSPVAAQALAMTQMKAGFAAGAIKHPFLAVLLRNKFENDMDVAGSNLEQDTFCRTRMQGAVALVALRRWYGTHREPPPDLATLCRDVGITILPRDFYSDGPLKLRTITADTPFATPYQQNAKLLAGETIIYSVGKNGMDDRGVIEDSYKQPGDLVLRLEVPQSAFTVTP